MAAPFQNRISNLHPFIPIHLYSPLPCSFISYREIHFGINGSNNCKECRLSIHSIPCIWGEWIQFNSLSVFSHSYIPFRLLFGEMLARSLCSISKGAVRAASVLPQIPAMSFSTNLKISTDKKKVRRHRLVSHSLAEVQTV